MYFYISPNNEMRRWMKSEIKVFKALSDPNRLRIIKMLEVSKMCVCEITSLIKLAPSTISKHLSLLKDAGLIEDSKKGKWVYYNLSPQKNVTDYLSFIKTRINDDETILKDREIVNSGKLKNICEIN